MYRAKRKKTIYLSVAVGTILSLLYVCINVMPYTEYKYHQSPYTLWIGSFSSSIFAELFFMMVPILAALAMSDIFLTDKKSGYLNLIVNMGKKKEYSINLFLANFLMAGLCVVIPLIINIYCCFCLLPDIKPDIIAAESTVVSLYGNDTLLPQLYYAHPLAHMLLYVAIGFVTAGMMASIALAASTFLKNKFFVWLSPFLLNYIYMSVLVAVLQEGTRAYLPGAIMRQVSGAGNAGSVVLVLSVGLVGSMILYFWRMKKSVSV